MVRLTKAELEAARWCVNTLSTSWLGAPDGTAIDGLKQKLLSATDLCTPRVVPAKAGDIAEDELFDLASLDISDPFG